MKILIHCGHWNIKDNCLVSLRTGTGAPGEADFNKGIGIRLEKLLQEDGHTTYLDDANTNCKKNLTSQNWDLALAIHADANIYGTGGGFVDTLRPDWDPAKEQSAKIAQAIRDRYFPETGIVNHPERSNVNTREYYLWNYMSDSTPCVIIECGVLLDAHDSVILSDTDRVAKGIREGIRKYSGFIPPQPPTPPTEPCKAIKAELDALKKVHAQCSLLVNEVSTLKTNLLIVTKERDEAVRQLKDVTDLKTRLSEKISKAQVALS